MNHQNSQRTTCQERKRANNVRSRSRLGRSPSSPPPAAAETALGSRSSAAERSHQASSGSRSHPRGSGASRGRRGHQKNWFHMSGEIWGKTRFSLGFQPKPTRKPSPPPPPFLDFSAGFPPSSDRSELEPRRPGPWQSTAAVVVLRAPALGARQVGPGALFRARFRVCA